VFTTSKVHGLAANQICEDGHNNREAQAPSAKQFDEYRNMDKVWNNDVGLHVAIRVPV